MKRIIRNNKINGLIHIPKYMLEETGMKYDEYLQIQNVGNTIVISKCESEETKKDN